MSKAALAVANEILRQLGGRKFLVMTGAKKLVGDAYNGESLSFRVGKNPKGVSAILIKLNGLDLYDIQAYQIRNNQFTEKGRENNVYVEDLQQAFTRLTGINTHL